MADNTNSPLDLGTLIINGNDAMMSNKSQSSTGNDIQSQLVSKNPVTGLSDDQASALSAVIQAAHKEHAKEFVAQNGVDNAAALVALHNLTSPQGQDGESTSGDSSNTYNSTTQTDPRVAQLQQRQFDIAMQNPPGILKNLLLGASIREQNKQSIANLQEAQKSLGGEQMQQAELQKTALPLTAEQKKDAAANFNTALISQHNDLQKNITEQMTGTATAIDQLVKNTPLLNKAPGSPYYDTLHQLQDRLTQLSTVGKDAVNKFKNLQLVNPATGKTTESNDSSFSPGQSVVHNGKTYIFKGINPKTGKAILQ